MKNFRYYFYQIPPVVRTLLVLNIAMFVAQQFYGGWLIDHLALSAHPFWSQMQIWRAVSYLFLHGSFFHLLFNLFTLWMFGKEIESAWGSSEFLKFYLACGCGAGIFHVLASPYSMMPTIGASGAIYGILIAFGMMFPNLIVYIYGIIPMKSRYFVLLIAAIEFIASVKYSASPVAHLAHLGGMLIGYVYIKFYEFRSQIERFFSKFIGSIIEKQQSPPKRKIQRSRGKNPSRGNVVEITNLDDEVNRILDKISSQGGMQNLTKSELKILEHYAAQKRAK